MKDYKTKDLLCVKQLLGHRCLDSIILCTQLVCVERDDYYCKIGTTPSVAAKLMEAGFDYVCKYKNTMLFRKRK